MVYRMQFPPHADAVLPAVIPVAGEIEHEQVHDERDERLRGHARPQVVEVQIRDAVQRDLQVQRRQTRRRDLEELRRLDSEADSAHDLDTKHSLGEKARALADKYLEDEEVVSSANGLLQKLNLPSVTGKGANPEATSAATLSFAAAPTIESASPKQSSAVVPAAPALKDIDRNPAYRDALLKADLCITDSAFMVLIWNRISKQKIHRLSGLKYLRELLRRQGSDDQRNYQHVLGAGAVCGLRRGNVNPRVRLRRNRRRCARGVRA